MLLVNDGNQPLKGGPLLAINGVINPYRWSYSSITLGYTPYKQSWLKKQVISPSRLCFQGLGILIIQNWRLLFLMVGLTSRVYIYTIFNHKNGSNLGFLFLYRKNFVDATRSKRGGWRWIWLCWSTTSSPWRLGTGQPTSPPTYPPPNK